MSRLNVFLFGPFAVLLIGVVPVFAEHPEPELTGEAKRQREIARLMNIVKNAPEQKLVDEARDRLHKMGLVDSDVTEAMNLDNRLVDFDPAFRFRASKRLVELHSPARVVAIGNLQKLIAAETDPNLLWRHAVTLAMIDRDAGSALELIQQTSHDPILKKSLGLRDFGKEERLLAKNEQEEKNQKSEGDITERFPSDEDNGGSDRPPRSIEEVERLRQLRRELEDERQRDLTSEPFIGPYSVEPIRRTKPPPPPQKIPAHPLIAERRFDKILSMMDQGSEEAWELYRQYGQDFPQPNSARLCMARAFGSDSSEREQASMALWHIGGDAELAAALAYAVVHDLCIAHQVDMIDRIERPGPFSREAIKRLRGHDNPRIRKAVLEAMARSPGMEALLFDGLKNALKKKNPAIRIAAIQAVAQLPKLTPQLQSWVEQVMLEETNPAALTAAASILHDTSLSAEFQRDVFERFNEEESAEINLILTDCLLDHVPKESATAKKLQKLKESLIRLNYFQTIRQLQRELEAMIRQTNAAKKKTKSEMLQKLEELELLD